MGLKEQKSSKGGRGAGDASSVSAKISRMQISLINPKSIFDRLDKKKKWYLSSCLIIEQNFIRIYLVEQDIKVHIA